MNGPSSSTRLDEALAEARARKELSPRGQSALPFLLLLLERTVALSEEWCRVRATSDNNNIRRGTELEVQTLELVAQRPVKLSSS